MEVNYPHLNMDLYMIFCSLAASVVFLLLVLTYRGGLVYDSKNKKRFLGGVEKEYYEELDLKICTVGTCLSSYLQSIKWLKEIYIFKNFYI